VTAVGDGRHQLAHRGAGGNRTGDQRRLEKGRRATGFGGEGRLTGGAW
jgi:hypothetical protein